MPSRFGCCTTYTNVDCIVFKCDW